MLLSDFHRVTHNWWPATCKQAPRITHKHWDMTDELTSDNSLFLKGSRIVIPPALREPFLHIHICKEHAGITKYQFMARALIYWPGMDRIREDYINCCPVCIKLLSTSPAEPLVNLDFCQGPWQKIRADFMDWDSNSHLLVIDYFSKYPFLFPVFSTTVTAINDHLTDLFALKRTPI